MTLSVLKIVSLIMTVIGAGAGIAGSIIDGKIQDKKIAEAVAEALAKKGI